MGSNPGQGIYEILKEELSDITAGIIVRDKCNKIGKTPDTITPEDLKNLLPLIMGPVPLFGGEEKSHKIIEKLDSLTKS